MPNDSPPGATITTTRRTAVAAGLAGVTTALLPSTGGGSTANAGRQSSDPSGRRPGQSRPQTRMPVTFIPHGGGPWPFVDVGMARHEVDAMAGYLRALPALTKAPPQALLVISAHWEEPVPTVMTAERPTLLYDYSGFPPESYRLTWPAPGHPALAARVRQLLGAAGLNSADNDQRGFDHGAFVPLKLAYPEARIPTIQLSLQRGLDPRQHLSIGRALAPLRDEGIFIVGSGMSFHNMRAFGNPAARGIAEGFDSWLQQTAKLPRAERDARLVDWLQAPGARLAHPREEHLLPLMVVAGAAGNDRGTTAFDGHMMGVRVSGYQFG